MEENMNYRINRIIRKNELYHHGILGQKWGVRRYQNFDGTYTKAGLERYYNSKSIYEKKKNEYDSYKKTDASRYDKKMAKSKVKLAKQQMNKDYKHLKYDKLGDKGKIRYNNGERIRANNKVSNTLTKAGGIAISGSLALNRMGILNNKYTTIAAGSGLISIGSGAVIKAIKNMPNKELSAYYSHSSKY